MQPSNSARDLYPQWLRCVVVLLLALCFPALILAACLGASVPWPMAAIAGLLSDRAFAALCARGAARKSGLQILLTQIVEHRPRMRQVQPASPARY